MIKGIIFDMDGTMIDNMMVHHRAWKRKLESLGLSLTLEEVMEKVHGINVEILERLFGDRFTPEERVQISAEKEAEYRQIFASEIKLLPGLTAFLQTLKQAEFPMGIGTAAPPENVDFVMDRLNLRPFFNTVFHSGNVVKGKPDPEVFQKVAAGIGVDPSDCLVFEDSLTGAETALRAGCRAIIVTTTHRSEEFAHFPHIVKYIRDFTEVSLEEIYCIPNA